MTSRLDTLCLIHKNIDEKEPSVCIYEMQRAKYYGIVDFPKSILCYNYRMSTVNEGYITFSAYIINIRNHNV